MNVRCIFLDKLSKFGHFQNFFIKCLGRICLIVLRIIFPLNIIVKMSKCWPVNKENIFFFKLQPFHIFQDIRRIQIRSSSYLSPTLLNMFQNYAQRGRCLFIKSGKYMVYRNIHSIKFMKLERH